MEKEMLIPILIIIAILFGAYKVLENGNNSVANRCANQCIEIGAEYANSDLGVNGYKNSCSCKKDGDIKPIW